MITKMGIFDKSFWKKPVITDLPIENVEKPFVSDEVSQLKYRQMVNVATTYIEKKQDVIEQHQKFSKKLEAYADNTEKKTIQDWRLALVSARDIQHPNRLYLIDLFTELKLDPFLDSVVNFQKSKLTSITRVVKDENGEEMYDMCDLFNGSWFDQFISAYVDATLQGFSVLEIDKLVKKNGIMTINRLDEINPKNIIPERQLVKKNQFSDSVTFPYTNNDFIIEIISGNNRNLGILSKLAPYLIYKKLALGSWGIYTEQFSVPSIIIKTPIKNTDKEAELMNQLNNMGQAVKMIMDTNDDFEFIQPNNTDVYQTFKELISMTNDQISNEVIGGTLLFSASQGGSYNLSSTHETVSALKTKSDLKDIERYVNTYLIPQLRRLGLVSEKECYFSFMYEEYLTLSARAAIDAQLLPYYKFSKEYIEDTYKVEIDDDLTEETNKENGATDTILPSKETE